VPIDRRLKTISCAAKGESAWPPLALFKAMLLAVWHGLSDVKLAEAHLAAPRSVLQHFSMM
jgi:IS5 family transposase